MLYKKSDFKIDGSKMKMLLKLGLPSSVQQVVVSFSFLTLTALVNSLPNADIASACQGIGGKVNSFAILPALAMSSAVSSMAGQNIGAGEIERAKKTMFTGMGIAFAMSVFVFALVAEPCNKRIGNCVNNMTDSLDKSYYSENAENNVAL